MKKMKKLLAVLTAMIFAAMPLSSHGESLADKVNEKLGAGTQTEQELNDGGLKVTVDRQRLNAVPINDNGSVLVPMRVIFEALDALVEWDGETQSVYCRKNNVWAVLKIGDKNVTVIDQNGNRTVTLAAAPKIIDGSTYVPVRTAEILNAKVIWHGDENWVEIFNTEGLNHGFVSHSPNSYLIGGIAFNGSLYTLDCYGRLIVCNEDGAREIKKLFSYTYGDEFVGPVRNNFFFTSDNSLYKVNISTGEKTLLLKSPGKSMMMIYFYANGYLCCGYKENIYVIDTLSDKNKCIYSGEKSKGPKPFGIYNDTLFMFSHIDELSREITAVDIGTGDKEIIYTKKYDTTTYTYFDKKQNGSCLYWKERFKDETYEYYKLNCDDHSVEEISKEEYDKQVYLSTYDTGGFTLKEDFYFLAKDLEHMYYYKIIDHKPSGNDVHLYYTIYMFDSDGSNPKAICTYNGKASSGGGSSATGNNNTSQKRTCSSCGGDGLITCHTCHGTLGHYIRMLGEQVWQGCVTCGQTGTVICDSCGGSGVV